MIEEFNEKFEILFNDGEYDNLHTVESCLKPLISENVKKEIDAENVMNYNFYLGGSNVAQYLTRFSSEERNESYLNRQKWIKYKLPNYFSNIVQFYTTMLFKSKILRNSEDEGVQDYINSRNYQRKIKEIFRLSLIYTDVFVITDLKNDKPNIVYYVPYRVQNYADDEFITLNNGIVERNNKKWIRYRLITKFGWMDLEVCDETIKYIRHGVYETLEEAPFIRINYENNVNLENRVGITYNKDIIGLMRWQLDTLSQILEVINFVVYPEYVVNEVVKQAWERKNPNKPFVKGLKNFWWVENKDDVSILNKNLIELNLLLRIFFEEIPKLINILALTRDKTVQISVSGEALKEEAKPEMGELKNFAKEWEHFESDIIRKMMQMVQVDKEVGVNYPNDFNVRTGIQRLLEANKYKESGTSITAAQILEMSAIEEMIGNIDQKLIVKITEELKVKNPLISAQDLLRYYTMFITDSQEMYNRINIDQVKTTQQADKKIKENEEKRSYNPPVEKIEVEDE